MTNECCARQFMSSVNLCNKHLQISMPSCKSLFLICTKFTVDVPCWAGDSEIQAISIHHYLYLQNLPYSKQEIELDRQLLHETFLGALHGIGLQVAYFWSLLFDQTRYIVSPRCKEGREQTWRYSIACVQEREKLDIGEHQQSL